MPDVSFFTTERLRSMAFEKSYVTFSAVMPNSSACSNRLTTSAFRIRALLGMQPQLRHTPPTSDLSTIAVLRSSWAALMAATYPPGPLPMTTTSKSANYSSTP